MNQTKVTWLLIAFILSFFAAGIPYWLIPYNRASLPSVLMGPGLLVAVFAALFVHTDPLLSGRRLISWVYQCQPPFSRGSWWVA